jgi:hypothetical protein
MKKAMVNENKDEKEKGKVDEFKKLIELIKYFPPPKGPVFSNLKEYNWRAYS